MLTLALLACNSSTPEEPAPTDTDTDTDVDTDVPTGPPTDTDPPTPAFDCSTVPDGPWTATILEGPPASEDFAFDGDTLISVAGTFLVRSLHPPGGSTPWVGTEGGPGGPASLRMLPNGDVVYHDVDTATLYRIEPNGGIHVVVSSFAYAGGMEIHPNGHVYVVDIAGIHYIEPFDQTDILGFQSAPWQTANGITLSADHTELLISARNGLWSIPVDSEGAPTGAPTLWADPPPPANELLGMGTDICGNVYVTASLTEGGSAIFRYPSTGDDPELMLQVDTGWFSNLQWGSGSGGWDALSLYVTDQYSGDQYQVIPVGVPEKLRTSAPR